MVEEALATPPMPPRRRDSWSLKTLVEEISGRPISELQDPDRPPHPYLSVKGGTPRAAPAKTVAAEVEVDPIDRVYPPLSGATGRSLHGAEHEHHGPTLRSVGGADNSGAAATDPLSPTKRPERIYLHYLLLHLDRLNPSALRYLRHAVDEELRHRDPSAALPTPPE